MRFGCKRFSVLFLALCMVAGCAGSPTVQKSNVAKTAVAAPANQNSNPANFTAAKRFLRSWGAGEVIQISLQRTMEKVRIDQPGMAELAQRVFADLKIEDFEDIAARVYARHLSQENLEALAQFSDTPAGRHFFKAAIAAVLDGKKFDQTMMRDFNADELTEILKFGQSDVFGVWQTSLPDINREMGEAARKLGQDKMREYLQRK